MEIQGPFAKNNFPEITALGFSFLAFFSSGTAFDRGEESCFVFGMCSPAVTDNCQLI